MLLLYCQVTAQHVDSVPEAIVNKKLGFYRVFFFFSDFLDANIIIETNDVILPLFMVSKRLSNHFY